MVAESVAGRAIGEKAVVYARIGATRRRNPYTK